MSTTILRDKQYSFVAYTGNWQNLGGGTAVQLEAAFNTTDAKGTFGNYLGGGRPLADTTGSSAVVLTENVHFAYNKRLDASTTEDPTNGFGSTAGGIVDTGVSGALSAGKSIRIVEGIRNITNASGLNLDVYAKNLSSYSGYAAFPDSKNKGYVDPARGKFILPQPVYWNKMETGLTPTISLADYPQYYDGWTGVTTGKFGSAYYRDGYLWDGAYGSLYPFGNNNVTFMDSGTLVYWWYPTFSSQCTPQVLISITPTIYTLTVTGNSNPATRIMSGTTVLATNEASGIVVDTWNHVMITWDAAYGLTSGHSVRAYVNGVFVVGYAASLAGNKKIILQTNAPVNIGGGRTIIDNVKVWNHVIGTSSTFDYNSGTGREDAMHSIYSSANGYKPALTGVNQGVGYYYIAQTTDAALLEEADATGASAMITI